MIEESKQGAEQKIDDSSSDGEVSDGSISNERKLFTGDEHEMQSETKSATQKPLMSSSITSMEKMLLTQERKGKPSEYYNYKIHKFETLKNNQKR